MPPKRIFKGVVSGVRDYGNRMGIPTINGSIIFDDGYLYNPLVYCGCVGIIPKDKIHKKVSPGQLLIVIGGKTGRDGIHGATFSSAALHNELPTSVVQIGDPITEKMFLDVLLKARDLGLYTAITDCGAGGLSSACGELAKDYGCKIYLDKVPLKYEGMQAWEIWLSESQERMVVVVNKEKKEKFIALCKEEDVEATVIGEVTDNKTLEVFYNGEIICKLDMDFLHNGVPKVEFNLTFEKKKSSKNKKVDIKIKEPFSEILKKVLSHPNICSKEYVIRQYDHEVQGNTVLKPLVGFINDRLQKVSPQDAAVICPVKGSYRAVAISCGINPLYGKEDVVAMTESVIDEAIRNIISVGGNLNRIFLLDNFCWGDVKEERQMVDLVLSCETAKNVSVYFGTPFISGKDSLNNYFLLGNKKINIPETLLISAIGVIDDVRNTFSSDFKSFNNDVYLIGETRNEFGGSVLFDVLSKKGGNVPSLNYNLARNLYKTFEKIRPYLLSVHDCSDGGMITAVVEMTFGRSVGVELNLTTVKDLMEMCFSESNARFVVEVMSEDKNVVEKILSNSGIPFYHLGKTVLKPYISIRYKNNFVLNESIRDLYNIWSKGLKI